MCTRVHIVNAADVAAGQVTNVVYRYRSTPAVLPVTTAPSTVTVPLTSSIGLTKAVTTAGPYRVGQPVAYSYVVTNTGGSDLSSVAVTDNRVAYRDLPYH